MAARRLRGPALIKRQIRRRSIRRGPLGGSPFWTVVFAAGYVGRWTGKVTKRGPMPIRFSEKLQPGEAFEIRHIDPNE